jgi:hypothetical protein
MYLHSSINDPYLKVVGELNEQIAQYCELLWLVSNVMQVIS